jgi:hypothetical protein
MKAGNDLVGVSIVPAPGHVGNKGAPFRVRYGRVSELTSQIAPDRLNGKQVGKALRRLLQIRKLDRDTRVWEGGTSLNEGTA